jgi:hypothetical protein
MLQVDRTRLLDAAKKTGWDLNDSIHGVYDSFRFRNGRPPPLAQYPGDPRTAIQKALMDCNADLGARNRIDWAGFSRKHQGILKRLAQLPRLGELEPSDIDRVCAVVEELEDFKQTTGRKLVFGSKVAHFHFPWLVPSMSGEVECALREIDRTERRALEGLMPGPGRKFLFASAASMSISYRNYVVLGNVVMRDVDSGSFLGSADALGYSVDAKVFEWWVIAYGLLGVRGP